MPHEKKKCKGCGRQIANKGMGALWPHKCEHRLWCVYARGIGGNRGPGGHQKAERDPQYRACLRCAEKWGWSPVDSH